jgi:hypothetical protein
MIFQAGHQYAPVAARFLPFVLGCFVAIEHLDWLGIFLAMRVSHAFGDMMSNNLAITRYRLIPAAPSSGCVRDGDAYIFVARGGAGRLDWYELKRISNAKNYL